MKPGKEYAVTVVKYSCLVPDLAVWVYRGPSKEAARIAYWRACKKEIERVKRFGSMAAKRKAGLQRLLSDCMANLPLTGSLTPAQKAAAKVISTIAETPQTCYKAFYDHIIEERRRRERDKKIRQQMREREAAEKAARISVES